MEKNHIIGFILIFATLLIWTWTTAPSEAEIAEMKRKQDSIAQAEVIVDPKLAKESTTTSTAITGSNETESDSGEIQTKAETVSIQNDELSLDFSTKGGRITNATLLKFEDSYYDRDNEETPPVSIMSGQNDKWEYLFQDSRGRTINSSDLYFVPTVAGNKVTMRAELLGGGAFVQEYTFNEKDYGLDYVVKTEGYNTTAPLKFIWHSNLPKLERSDLFEQRYSTVYYQEQEDEDVDYCSCVSDDEVTLNASIGWVSHSNQFFNAALIPSKAFKSGDFKTVMTDLDSSSDLKEVTSVLDIDMTGTQSYDMKMYIGPNEFDNLKIYNNGLEQIIPFGTSIFGTINRYVVRPFFNFLSTFISSKGLVIILLIFIIKMILYPLMYKMLHSQAKMAALKPRIAKLKEKNNGDQQKTQMDTMKLYQEFGVSPLSGCMPMFLQMPIWIALYRFFPASITFRNESFLWAEDLSTFDAFFNLPFDIPFFGSHLSLFTLLWAVTTLIYTYYNTKHMDMSANPAMKYVQYLMPLMFLGFFNSYASGLTCYMLFSNLFNISQTVITKKFVFDDEKIAKELDAKRLKIKANPKKTSGFQARLQEAYRQQQEAQAKKGKK